MAAPPSTSNRAVPAICLIAFALVVVIFTAAFLPASAAWTTICSDKPLMLGYQGPDSVILIFILAVFAFSACVSIYAVFGLGSRHFLVGDGYQSSREIARNVALFSGLAALACLPFLYLDAHCVSAEGVSLRQTPWSPVERYPLSHVKEIEVDCEYVEKARSHGYWSDTFSLLLDNGTYVLVGGGEISKRVDPKLIHLADALGRYPVAIDSSRVRTGCVPPELEMFKGRFPSRVAGL